MATSRRIERLGARLGTSLVKRPLPVVLAWLVIAGLLNLLVPQLETVVARDATPFVPRDAPAVQAFEAMDEVFGSGEAAALAFVVVERDGPITAADRAWYGELANRLRAGEEHVADVQDPVSSPALAKVLVSQDGRAAYLPVAVRHPVGSPEATRDVEFVRTQAAGAPVGLRVYVTGDPATIVDTNEALDANVLVITVLSVLIIVGLLAVIYRRLVTVLIPLVTIGVALATARGSVALLGERGLPVSTYTAAFLTAIVLGAGTDYTIFLLARYHERLRAGDDARPALARASGQVAPVLVAAAATVAAGTACMSLTDLALFRTTGPSLAVSILVTLLVSLTLTPALTAVAGLRAGPRPGTASPTKWWTAIGALVVRRPVPVLAAGLVALLALASAVPSLDRSFDVRASQPVASESAAGERALGRHFPAGELRADYLLIRSDHDLRSSADLVALEAVADAVSRAPGVQAVRGVTRPEGKEIEQAGLPSQLETVGDRLAAAGTELQRGSSDARRLSRGADSLQDGAQQLAGGAAQADAAAGTLADGLRRAEAGTGRLAEGASRAQSGATALGTGARSLADGLGQARAGAAEAVEALERITLALEADAVCSTDPICRQAREGLREVYEGERDELLPALGAAEQGATRLAEGSGSLARGLSTLDGGVGELRSGLRGLTTGADRFSFELDRLAGGADAVAEGTGRLAPGVGRAVDATAELQSGLDEAAGFLNGTADGAKQAGVSAFYLPPAAFQDKAFSLARAFYLSGDGRTARLVVYGQATTESGAEDRLAENERAARAALRGTPLEDARILSTGPAAATRDLRALAAGDLALMVIAVLGVILLTLILLLRSLVAPLYLLGSVLLSYGAAIGLTVLVWQGLLGEQVDWTVPVLAFVLLVAVGVDYNILLISRIREEAPSADRAGIARAVASTGGVITAAGVIFAGSFVAMLFSPLTALAQNGFTIAVGLLLDTFIVRTLLVPSLATLLGPANWWPSVRRDSSCPSGERAAAG